MRFFILLIFGLSITINVSGQTGDKKIDLVNNHDEIIDTIKIDNNHYIRFYRKNYTEPINLDFDSYTDTIVWYNYMEESIEGSVAFYEMGQQIRIRNRLGTTSFRGIWGFIDKKFEKYLDSITHKKNEFIIFQKLDSKTTGLILTHQLFGSDIYAYSIIGVDSLSKPKMLFDTTFILTSIEDLDNDGFNELIGKHPNAGIPEYSGSFVPFIVLKYSGSLHIDNNLTYSYNLPYKKYRNFPQGSIMILSEKDLSGYRKEELSLMRNEIYADHGFVFKSKDLNDYFTNKTWYKPIEDKNIILTDWEKTNIDLILKMENK